MRERRSLATESRADSGASLADDHPAGTFAIRPDEFGRVVDNLMTNALRAIGDAGRLDVSLSRDGHDLVQFVADTGGGMDPEFVPSAFDRFSRADEARSGRHGLGLGLAIVSAIVHNAGAPFGSTTDRGRG